MRFAVGCFLSAVLLIGSDAMGVVGPWALPVAVVVLLLAAVSAAVAMEAGDDRAVEALAATATAVRQPSVPAPAAERSLGDVA